VKRLLAWFTLARIWAIVSVLAVIVLIVSLIAPVFTQGL
jgi:hypothetical protein